MQDKYKRILQILAVIFTVFALDQWSKHYAINLLLTYPGQKIQIFEGFNLVLVLNYGVSFGMFNDASHNQMMLVALALAIIIGLIIWYWREPIAHLRLPIAMVIGGALGNVADRFNYGAVIDFLDFHWQQYHYPAFNIADSFIVAGVAIMIFYMYRYPDPRQRG